MPRDLSEMSQDERTAMFDRLIDYAPKQAKSYLSKKDRKSFETGAKERKEDSGSRRGYSNLHDKHARKK